MAAEWHYSKEGKQHGPVSASVLKNLAKTGNLLPTDLIWKEGMAEWKPAKNLKGLFLTTPVSANESPTAFNASPQVESLPVVPETTNRQSLVESAKGAARYAAKQAERTKLVNLTLPPLYQALGRHAFTSPAYRAEFAEVFQQLDQVQVEQSEIKGRTPLATKSFGEKAKAMAGQAMDAAQSQKLSLRQSSLFGTLGKTVYDKHEAASGPQELVQPIADAMARLAMLDSELDGLSVSKEGSWISPKQMAIAVGGIGCLALLLFVLFGFGRTTSLHAGRIPLKGEQDREYEDNTYVVMRADKTIKKETRKGLIRVEFIENAHTRSWDLGDNVHYINLYAEDNQGRLIGGAIHQEMIGIRHVGKDVEMLLQVFPPIWATFIKDGEKPGGKWRSINGKFKHVCEYVTVESTNGGTAVLEDVLIENNYPVVRRRWYLQQAGGVMRLDIFGSEKSKNPKYWVPIRQLIRNDWKGDRSSLTLDEIDPKSLGK